MQVVTTHTGCDFDALASMVAAKKLYPEAKLCLPGSPSQEVRDFLHLYGWMIPTEKLNEKDLEQVKKLILVDTRWTSRIGIFGKLVGKKGVKIHIYDHHPPHPLDIKADVEVCRQVGATTSILVEFIRKRKISVNPFEATLFVLGIYEDTGSLSFSSTTSCDLRSVAYLLDKGAKLEFCSGFLNRGLTEKQDILLKDFLEKAQTIWINGVEVVIIATQIEDFVGGLSQPLHKFINLKNPDVVFAIVRSRDKVYIMARSRLFSVNVDDILSPFGGGGHSLAASAILKGVDLEDIKKKLYSVLEEKISPYLTVEKVMSSSARCVFPEMKAKEVKKILEEENLEALPVQEKGKIVGVISRQKVENMIKYNSGDISIKSYYTKKFVRISPSFSLKKAQQIMMEEEVPWLLVFEDQKFRGILTSLDIFEAYNKDFPGDNLKFLLEKKVPSHIMDILVEAGKLAEKMSMPVFIVGGFVRDLLLGNENFDIDLLVEGDGIAFARKLAVKLKASLTAHPEFGTATLDLGEGFRLDIATSRREFYPRPAVLPRVEKAPLREDLFRRDFTVNAMAISINPSDFGRLIDFFGGREDLECSRVRVLHSRSFIDDPTRIFRAIRFEQRYGFRIDKDTENLIKEALKADIFSHLSGKRIKEELVQILEEDRPGKIICRMQQLGVLQVIQPGIRLTSFRDKVLDELVDAIARYELLTGTESRRWLMRLALLLNGLEKDRIDDFCTRYSFTREEREALFASIRGVREIIARLGVPRVKPSSIYYLLSCYPPEALAVAMAKTKSKQVKKRIIFYLSTLQKVKVQVRGDDLKKMGFRPSPKFSQILEEVKKAKLDGLVKTKQEEIEFIRKKFLPGRKG